MSNASESPSSNQPSPPQAPFIGVESGVRMLVPRAGGRVMARFTTVVMTLVVATPNQVYLPAVALAVLWIAVAAGWNGSVKLPMGIGRVCGQLREHLFRVTADWFTVAGYLIVSLLWTFLDPRPAWLNAVPVLLVAFACWAASFAALPTGAMGRWFAFRWRLISDSLGGPFRGKKQEEPPKPMDSSPAPAPINPIESTHWPSQQQERFDDWLAEEVLRFESEEATPTGLSDRNATENDNPASTQQLKSIGDLQTGPVEVESTETEPVDLEPADPTDADEVQSTDNSMPGISKIKKLQ